MKKEIKIDDSRLLTYSIIDGYTETLIIKEFFIENNKVVKNYTLSRWDDYGFNTWINANLDELENINKVSYEFDIEHPLYKPLLNLLDNDEELIIDDDNTYEFNKKYMKLYKNNNIIYIDFVNRLIDIDLLEKFSIFIKNIGSDARSKIAIDSNVKIRLYRFFMEVFSDFSLDEVKTYSFSK